MSRAPVDVLRVINRAHAAFTGEQAAEIHAAGDAVVKLIEAAHAYRQWLNSGGLHGGDSALFRKAEAMNRAALARVTP